MHLNYWACGPFSVDQIQGWPRVLYLGWFLFNHGSLRFAWGACAGDSYCVGHCAVVASHAFQFYYVVLPCSTRLSQVVSVCWQILMRTGKCEPGTPKSTQTVSHTKTSLEPPKKSGWMPPPCPKMSRIHHNHNHHHVSKSLFIYYIIYPNDSPLYPISIPYKPHFPTMIIHFF